MSKGHSRGSEEPGEPLQWVFINKLRTHASTEKVKRILKQQGK